MGQVRLSSSKTILRQVCLRFHACRRLLEVIASKWRRRPSILIEEGDRRVVRPGVAKCCGLIDGFMPDQHGCLVQACMGCKKDAVRTGQRESGSERVLPQVETSAVAVECQPDDTVLAIPLLRRRAAPRHLLLVNIRVHASESPAGRCVLVGRMDVTRLTMPRRRMYTFLSSCRYLLPPARTSCGASVYPSGPRWMPISFGFTMDAPASPAERAWQ